MVTLQSILGHAGQPNLFNFWHSGTLALSPERQSARVSKNENGGLDQYGAEHFGRLMFATVRKSVGLKALSWDVQTVAVNERWEYLFSADEDISSGFCDQVERIRLLNEEIAKEPPVPEDKLSQSSVKFKDKLVDFISPTPELYSEEDAPSTQEDSPRSDATEQSPRQPESSDPSYVLAEAGTSTSTKDETSAESDEQDQSLPMPDDSHSSTTSPSEAGLTTSDQKLNSVKAENKSIIKKTPRTNAQSSAESMQANARDPSAASGTDEDCILPSNDPREQHHNSAVGNTTLAAKVVNSLGRWSGSPRPRSAEVKPAEGSRNNLLAPCDAAMAAGVANSCRKSSGNLTPKSAESWRNAERVADPESDDMALVECSGRFRMMSVAELTALQRRSASSRSPDTVSRTPRSPSRPLTYTPRSSESFELGLFYFNNVNKGAQIRGQNWLFRWRITRKINVCI